jgi:hypothetical protein
MERDFYNAHPAREGHKLILDRRTRTDVLIDDVDGAKFTFDKDLTAGTFRFFPTYDA